MTLFDILSFAEQGIYDVVNNLGSLAARFILRPVEDSSYQIFAQLAKRDVLVANQDPKEVELAATVLRHLLRCMTILGLVIVIFGQSYSALLLQLYGGSILSEGEGHTLMRCHCFYVLILAVNGITECFAFAAMSKKNVDRYNFILMFMSVLFLFCSWFLTTRLGSVGFILANCANMLVRIAYSIRFTISYFKGSGFYPLRGITPSTPVLLSLVASYFITAASERSLCCSSGVLHWMLHVCVGGLCLLVVLGVVYRFERELINFVKEQWHHRKRN